MDNNRDIGVLQAEVLAIKDTMRTEREDNREFRTDVKAALAELKAFNIKVDTGGIVLKTLLAISVSVGALVMYIINIFHVKG